MTTPRHPHSEDSESDVGVRLGTWLGTRLLGLDESASRTAPVGVRQKASDSDACDACVACDPRSIGSSTPPGRYGSGHSCASPPPSTFGAVKRASRMTPPSVSPTPPQKPASRTSVVSCENSSQKRLREGYKHQ